MNELSIPARESMVRQVSLRQIIALFTLSALLAGILRHLRLDSVALYGFLLAPAILYTVTFIVGLWLDPMTRLARWHTILFGSLILLAIIATTCLEPYSLVLTLPIAALWMSQLVVSNGFQFAAEQQRSGATDSARKFNLLRLVFLSCVSLGFMATLACWYASSLGGSNLGKGTAFQRYWFASINHYGNEIQWEDHYAIPINWQWYHTASQTKPIDESFGFLGIVRYRFGSCEKLRIPVWLIATLLALAPVTLVIRFLTGRKDKAIPKVPKSQPVA